MKYDFDRVHSRLNTASVKWDTTEEIFGARDVLPMWVADMDFPTARPITEALEKRAAHPFYGYTLPGKSLIESVVERLQAKFGWKIEPEWIVFTAGVIPAISTTLNALTHPGDEVILQEPVYYPFFPVVKQNGCQVVTNQLRLANGRYEMDFDDLKAKFAPRTGMHDYPSRVKALYSATPTTPSAACGSAPNSNAWVKLPWAAAPPLFRMKSTANCSTRATATPPLPPFQRSSNRTASCAWPLPKPSTCPACTLPPSSFPTGNCVMPSGKQTPA